MPGWQGVRVVPPPLQSAQGSYGTASPTRGAGCRLSRLTTLFLCPALSFLSPILLRSCLVHLPRLLPASLLTSLLSRLCSPSGVLKASVENLDQGAPGSGEQHSAAAEGMREPTRAGALHFTPALPEAKVSAIRRMGFGDAMTVSSVVGDSLQEPADATEGACKAEGGLGVMLMG